jgi:large subunit ribosomal protein L10
MAEKTSRASGQKKEIVSVLSALLLNSPIVGVVNMEGLPANALQKISAQLRGRMELFMTKKRLMNFAVDSATKKNPDLEKIRKYLGGMPALLFTKENPFAIYKLIKKNKSPAAAKPGQTAPRDITVKAGPTPFTPGPVISELAAVGLKAGVEGGKVAIKVDSVVAKEGQKISAPLAGILAKLGIEPMEIGLNIVAIYEKGLIYGRDVLDVDEDKFLADIASASNSAINIAIEIGYTTKETVEVMIMKAALEHNALDVIVGPALAALPLGEPEPVHPEPKSEPAPQPALVHSEPKPEHAQPAPKPEPAHSKPEQTHQHSHQPAAGENISASQLVAEVEKDKEIIEHKKQLKQTSEMKQAEELYQQLKKKGTLRDAK